MPFVTTKRNRLQDKFRIAAFLIQNICSKNTRVFCFTKKYMKKTPKKLELNLNIEIGRAVLSTIFISIEKLWNHLCNSMLKETGQKSSHTSSYFVSAVEIYVQNTGQKYSLPFFTPSYINSPLVFWLN